MWFEGSVVESADRFALEWMARKILELSALAVRRCIFVPERKYV